MWFFGLVLGVCVLLLIPVGLFLALVLSARDGRFAVAETAGARDDAYYPPDELRSYIWLGQVRLEAVEAKHFSRTEVGSAATRTLISGAHAWQVDLRETLPRRIALPRGGCAYVPVRFVDAAGQERTVKQQVWVN